MKRIKKIVAAITSVCVGFFIAVVPTVSASTNTLGDVNNDGSINFIDTSIITSYLSGSCRLLTPNLADVNCDGVINRLDTVKLSAYLANTSTLPANSTNFTAPDMDTFRNYKAYNYVT